MKVKFIFLFTLYSLLFLFYPGDSELFHIFAFNRSLFSETSEVKKPVIHPIPVLKQNAQPFVTAESVYIADLASFTPVFEKSARTRLFPASTAKILSALVAHDIYKPEQIITIGQDVEDGQVMELVEGEKITIENLLYGLLVHSGNDAAYALADNYGRDKFIVKMNQKAQELHMKDSLFTNPAGLDEDNQYTTAFDLALAGRALLSNQYLSKIVSTKEIIISDVDFKYFHTLTNVNKLLGEIRGVGGLKTGYTELAGENLVSFYKRADGHDLIIIVLKSLDRFNDTTNLIQWIETNVDYIIL